MDEKQELQHLRVHVGDLTVRCCRIQSRSLWFPAQPGLSPSPKPQPQAPAPSSSPKPQPSRLPFHRGLCGLHAPMAECRLLQCALCRGRCNVRVSKTRCYPQRSSSCVERSKTLLECLKSNHDFPIRSFHYGAEVGSGISKDGTRYSHRLPSSSRCLSSRHLSIPTKDLSQL